ncbi:MAG: hypothetical protein PHV47_02250 [Candidatus Pacebacteria bacterium]|nr:hypothetical protein [Candidatus Paceibacterota bacterium]
MRKRERKHVKWAREWLWSDINRFRADVPSWLQPNPEKLPDLGEVRDACKEVKRDLELLDVSRGELHSLAGFLLCFRGQHFCRERELISAEVDKLCREVLRMIVQRKRRRG